MDDDNKAIFDKFARKVLELLVKACPLHMEITVETFNWPRGEYEKSSDSSGSMMVAGSYRQSPEEEFLEGTLKWLVEEGLIRKRGSQHYVATLRALELYESVPKSISPRKP